MATLMAASVAMRLELVEGAGVDDHLLDLATSSSPRWGAPRASVSPPGPARHRRASGRRLALAQITDRLAGDGAVAERRSRRHASGRRR
jgi:hypothetical protein